MSSWADSLIEIISRVSTPLLLFVIALMILLGIREKWRIRKIRVLEEVILNQMKRIIKENVVGIDERQAIEIAEEALKKMRRPVAEKKFLEYFANVEPTEQPKGNGKETAK